MSNYIHVLKRLEENRRMPAESAVKTAAPATVGAPQGSSAAASSDRPPPLSAAPAADAVTSTGTATKPAAAVPPTHPAVALRAMPPGTSRTSDKVATSEHPTVDRQPPAKPAVDRRRALSAETVKGIAALLDNIRVLATGRVTRTIVFAGASKSEPVEVVTAALATHAAQQGMAVFAATLAKAGGRSLIAPLTAHGTSDGTDPVTEVLEMDLDGASPSDLSTWLARVAPDVQLVIVSGPPLADSIDSALLACVADGLVIIAESEVTDRTALQVAAERARITGCRTLGVVMHGTKERVPAWLRRFMRSSDTKDAPRED